MEIRLRINFIHFEDKENTIFRREDKLTITDRAARGEVNFVKQLINTQEFLEAMGACINPRLN